MLILRLCLACKIEAGLINICRSFGIKHKSLPYLGGFCVLRLGRNYFLWQSLHLVGPLVAL